MKIFNIGIQEILLVLVIMLIFTGPERMEENARSLGRLLRRIVRSDAWKTFKGVYADVKEIPNQLMKEAELEELRNDLKHVDQDIKRVDHEIRADEEHLNE